jgi:hypothetical protein
MCIINSYTLWRLDSNADGTQLDFRRALLRQIPLAFPPVSCRARRAHSHRPYNTADGHCPSTRTTREVVTCAAAAAVGECGATLCVSVVRCICALTLASSCTMNVFRWGTECARWHLSFTRTHVTPLRRKGCPALCTLWVTPVS